MTKELDAFAKGYQQGYRDARYVYDIKRVEPGYSGATEPTIDPRFPAAHYENDLYVAPGCGCQTPMHCDGGCFPKAKNAADWK